MSSIKYKTTNGNWNNLILDMIYPIGSIYINGGIVKSESQQYSFTINNNSDGTLKDNSILIKTQQINSNIVTVSNTSITQPDGSTPSLGGVHFNSSNHTVEATTFKHSTFPQTVKFTGTWYTDSSLTPSQSFGGTWTRIEKKFLLGATSGMTMDPTLYQYNYDWDTAIPVSALVGSNSEHAHRFGFRYGGYYGSTALENNSALGCVDMHHIKNDYTLGSWTDGDLGSANSITQIINSAVTTSSKSVSMSTYMSYGLTSSTDGKKIIEPSIAVHIYKRTS